MLRRVCCTCAVGGGSPRVLTAPGARLRYNTTGSPEDDTSTQTVSSESARGMYNGYEYYGTFARAMYTLFQVMTGESWSEAIARPLVFGLFDNALVVSLFYVSFIILTQLVLTNVVVAVLLDNFVQDNDKGDEQGDAGGSHDVSADASSAFLDTISEHSSTASPSPAGKLAGLSQEAAAGGISPGQIPEWAVASRVETLEATVHGLQASVSGIEASMQALHEKLDTLLAKPIDSATAHTNAHSKRMVQRSKEWANSGGPSTAATNGNVEPADDGTE